MFTNTEKLVAFSVNESIFYFSGTRFLVFWRNIMKYIELYNRFSSWYFFSLHQIQLIEPDFRIRNIWDRLQQWYIKRITRGWYIFSDVSINEELSMIIANSIYTPSYISMEAALRYYNLIPEGVFIETSICTKKSQLLKWDVWVYKYYNLAAKHFWWRKLVYSPTWKRYYRMVESEKLICDFMYLKWYSSHEDFEGLRINHDSFREHVDENKLISYAKRFGILSLTKHIQSFIDYIHQDYDNT